ncbi:TonB-dependent receptor [Caulobacter sp. S45]|uniref:TonB-dependent receptor n=1 Tax=Caulobacter sp. S45 TaxID=1641861 RepID=UPI00131BDCBA|nr:TonB-dependent receptor [Caulobacter sp. S45]
MTAAKRDVAAFDLPGSVTQVDADRLSATDSLDIRDLRLLASGMTVTNLGPGRDKVLLRGLSDGAFTGHTQSTVGIYWEETPTTYNAPDPDLRLVDVQSVEVLRGPQGTLYGAGAIGGVVSIVPNKPAFDRASGSLSATGAATASGAPSAAGEGVFNTPLLDGKAAVRLVAYGEEDGGYIAEPLLGVTHSNGVQRVGVRGAFSFKPTPDWIVTLGNTYQDIYSADTQYTTGGADSLARDTQVREPHDNDFEQAYLDISGRGGWGDVRAVTSFIHHEFDSRYDATDALADFGGPAGAPAAYDDDTLIRLTSQELDYHPPAWGRLKLLMGAYGAYGDEHEQTRLGLTTGAPALYTEDRTDRLVDLALFGEADYALSSRFDLTLGLRAFYAQRRTVSSVVEGGDRDPFSGSTSMHDVAPKLSLQYRIAPSAMAYILASEGYRASGFNTAGTIGQAFSPQGGQQPNRTYQPDTLWNYEIGAKVQAFDGRLDARTAVYYDIWRKLQADQFLPSGLAYVANVGDAQVYGWEWEVSVKPIKRLTLQLGALFTAPDLHEVDPTFAAGRSDFTLPGVPRRSINGQVGYDLPLGNEHTLSFDATAVYVGHSYLFFGPQRSATMGDYLDARISAAFKWPRWALTLFVENPANNRADTFAFGNPFSLAAAPQTTPLRPRTIGLTVKRDF